jgi:hypothetical protein
MYPSPTTAYRICLMSFVGFSLVLLLSVVTTAIPPKRRLQLRDCRSWHGSGYFSELWKGDSMDHTQYSETIRNAKERAQQVAGRVGDAVRRNPRKTILISAATICGLAFATWMRRRKRS